MSWKLLIFFYIHQTCAQLTSPCPRLFRYEENNAETDRWFGHLTLISDSELSGVWLRLIFDKPFVQLGNWFGEIDIKGDRDYLIKNPKHKLLKNTPLDIRFYVKYEGNPPPQLVSFRLNAKTVCPEGQVTTEAPSNLPQLFTSSELETSSKPIFTSTTSTTTTKRPFFVPLTEQLIQKPSKPTHHLEEDEDDDYYKGDFAFLTPNKPAFPFHNRIPPGGAAKEQCGIAMPQPRPLIVNGLDTTPGEFPWHAALYSTKYTDLTYLCGGTLISKKHVITAAHCVTTRNSLEVLNTNRLVCYLGKFFLRAWSTAGIQDRYIQKIFVHPKYNPKTLQDSIAIIKLGKEADITNFVRPACLWQGDSSIDQIVGQIGTVAGWGFDETGTFSEPLTKAHMPIVSPQQCHNSFENIIGGEVLENSFCAGFQNGTSVCIGDTGGGLLFQKQNLQNSPWHLRGIVSLGVSLQENVKCEALHYTIFTDAAKYIDWIGTTLLHD